LSIFVLLDQEHGTVLLFVRPFHRHQPLDTVDLLISHSAPGFRVEQLNVSATSTDHEKVRIRREADKRRLKSFARHNTFPPHLLKRRIGKPLGLRNNWQHLRRANGRSTTGALESLDGDE